MKIREPQPPPEPPRPADQIFTRLLPIARRCEVTIEIDARMELFGGTVVAMLRGRILQHGQPMGLPVYGHTLFDVFEKLGLVGPDRLQ